MAQKQTLNKYRLKELQELTETDTRPVIPSAIGLATDLFHWRICSESKSWLTDNTERITECARGRRTSRSRYNFLNGDIRSGITTFNSFSK